MSAAAAANPTGAVTGAAPQVDQATANSDYMARSRNFPVRMPLIGGNLNGPYAVGSTLNFILGPVNNGWLEAIELDVNLSLQVATATLVENKAFPWNLISAITVNLDGQISYIEPYFVYLMSRMQGYMKAGPDAVLAGTQNSGLQATMLTVPASPIALGAASVRFRLYIPLNALHPLDGSGMLPAQGTQDPVQVNVICPSALVGVDPFIHPGSTATSVVTVNAGSTVTCYGWIRDGRTMWSPDEVLPFYPDGLPQVSYDKEPDIINLVAGSIVRGQLTKVLKIYYGVSCIIDGNSSTAFAANSNINSWDISGDSTGNFKLYQYGLENVPVDLLFEKIRRRFGQDFPEGVIPWVYAPQAKVPDPDNYNGTDILNMQAGGWTSLYQGVNLASIGGVAGIQPRVKTWILGTNDSPYIG